MKIVDVRATPVTVPLRRPLRWSFGVETATTRTIVELITDEGIVGIGETRGGDEVVNAIALHRDLFVGTDPFEVNRIARRFGLEVRQRQIGRQHPLAFQRFERGSDACFHFGEDVHGSP